MVESIQIVSKWLKDVNDVNFFPITHINAVKDENNDSLRILLDRKQNLITFDNKLDWDLVNHPTIPTVNDATLTIQRNGTLQGTFTANASSNKTINITVPTKTSDLTNDSGFLNGNSKLNSLQDVSITSASNNQSLVYENGMWKNGYPNEPVSITYSELVTLRNNSTLVPNRTYRITDYVTEINPYMTNLIYYMEGLPDPISDMEIARVSPNYVQYDILITAIDGSHLSEDCRIVPHSGVTFFDNYDITSWKLKYTIDNDVERFAWAKNYYNVTLTLDDGTVNGVMIKTKLKSKVNNVEGFDTYLFTAKVDGQCVNYIFGMENGHTPAASETVYEVFQGVALTINSATQVLGKGVVYSMEDCFSNKLCYDYLNIQYKLYAITDVTTTDSNLNECLSELKTALTYNANRTKARLASIVSTFNVSSRGINLTADFDNYDWYYTFDSYDEAYNTHKNVFYLCDNVTSEKSMSSCYYMYGLGPETWNLPYNVFQFNKSFINEFSLNGLVNLQRQTLLHSFDLSEYVYGNVWYYDDTMVQDPDSLLLTMSFNYVNTSRHVFGTIFSNVVSIDVNMCFYGLFVNSINVHIKFGNKITTYNVISAEIGMNNSECSFINVNDLTIGTKFSGYICNCWNISVGNSCDVKLIGNPSMNRSIDKISIGDGSIVNIFTDTDVSDTINNLVVGNYVYLGTVNSEKFTGKINSLTIGDNCNYIELKNDLYCENVVVEPNTGYVTLTSEGLPSGQYLSNIIVRQSPNINTDDYTLSTDFITESFITPHKVGRNSSGVVVCYVEEDLVAPAAYAPNGVTYTVSGNNITFTIPSGYTMYWTLDGRNPSILVKDGSATTSTTVSLTDGQTIKYISYNSSLPQDRWATQIYSYTHHVNEQ